MSYAAIEKVQEAVRDQIITRTQSAERHLKYKDLELARDELDTAVKFQKLSGYLAWYKDSFFGVGIATLCTTNDSAETSGLHLVEKEEDEVHTSSMPVHIQEAALASSADALNCEEGQGIFTFAGRKECEIGVPSSETPQPEDTEPAMEEGSLKHVTLVANNLEKKLHKFMGEEVPESRFMTPRLAVLMGLRTVRDSEKPLRTKEVFGFVQGQVETKLTVNDKAGAHGSGKYPRWKYLFCQARSLLASESIPILKQTIRTWQFTEVGAKVADFLDLDGQIKCLVDLQKEAMSEAESMSEAERMPVVDVSEK